MARPQHGGVGRGEQRTVGPLRVVRKYLPFAEEASTEMVEQVFENVVVEPFDEGELVQVPVSESTTPVALVENPRGDFRVKLLVVELGQILGPVGSVEPVDDATLDFRLDSGSVIFSSVRRVIVCLPGRAGKRRGAWTYFVA